MIFFLSSRLVCSVSAYLYPGYASYKTLSQRPASEEDIERWLMYWSVLGCIVGVEYVAEWAVSWIPFYYFFKTLFLLYISLPQTRGSSYIYIVHLQPFFAAHEHQIDATLARVKVRIYEFFQERARLLWDAVASSISQTPAQPVGGRGEGAGGVGGAPPRLGDPISGPATLLGGLWANYGPSIVAGGAALLKQTTPNALSQAALFAHATSSAGAQPLRSPPATTRQDSAQSVLERKRQLEAELAALSGVPMPAYSVSRNSSDVDLRSRGTGGRFEEIEVPSDVEGYDLGSGSESGKSGAGASTRPQGGRKGSSWFGWGAPEAKTKSD